MIVIAFVVVALVVVYAILYQVKPSSGSLQLLYCFASALGVIGMWDVD